MQRLHIPSEPWSQGWVLPIPRPIHLSMSIPDFPLFPHRAPAVSAAMPPRCSACGQLGHIRSSKTCPARAARGRSPPRLNKRRCTRATSVAPPATAAAPTSLSPSLSPMLADPDWQTFAQCALSAPPGIALELARFLAIVVHAQDWDAQTFSPSSAVVTAWRQLLLRPRLYARVCGLLGCPAGEVVGHDPDGAVDPAQQQAQYQATLGAYCVLYGPPAPELWPVDGRCGGEAVAAPAEGATPVNSEARTGAQISLMVVNAEGAEVYFKMKRTTPLAKVFDAYCKKQGINRRRCRFHFDGHNVSLQPHLTPEDWDMYDDVVLDCMVEQTGC